jgi:two-component system, OmpR family, response regulator
MSGAVAPPRLQKVQILVVDDSQAIRSRLVAMIAETDGVVAVHEASTADDAVARIEALRPDIVVLDLHLPGRNGLDILAAYQFAAVRPCFVVLTNEATGHHHRQSKMLGADHFFDKTSEFNSVIALIAELAAGR